MNTSQKDISQWDAIQTAEEIKNKNISAVEVAQAALERVAERDKTLNSTVFIDEERALKDAKNVDDKLAAGEELGPLAGVPTLLKDLYGYRPGWPSTLGGIPALKDAMSPEGIMSQYPLAMEESSAVMLGLTNSPSFGYRGVTDNKLFGPTGNPFDVTRNSGGSSGGSAAAVADGMVPLAGASDAGGSIRIPASWCGAFGYQPSAGLVPSVIRPNGFHLGTFVYEGPVSRTVRDSAHAMKALTRYTPYDPTSVSKNVDWLSALNSSVEGLRIGYSPDFGGYPVNPKVRALLDEAVQAFAEAGATIVDSNFKLPASHTDISRMWMTSISSLIVSEIDTHAEHGIDLTADGGIPDITLEWAQTGRDMKLKDIMQDRVLRTQILDAVLMAQHEVDLIVGPTLIDTAVKNSDDGNTLGPNIVDGQEVDPMIGWCPTIITNFSGSPSATVPVGLADGLPVGMMIIGRRFEDERVIAASAAFERLRPWEHLYEVPASRSL